MTTSSLEREASLEDLLAYDGRAELIDGEIVPMSPTGHSPVKAALRIGSALDHWERAHGGGYGYGDGGSFLIHTPRQQVLSPDAAWWTGTPDEHAPVIRGAPVFVVEVRSTTDYGPSAERAMQRKRDLWFAAGVQVLWDVDVLRQHTIRVFRADASESPVTVRRGEVADAEPAVPGWRFAVDDLFV
ncbi:Uma2 family endonuclease [Longimicrobium terrae]|uniref:Uma2 family endonuclease n=1 Tax=Longimicrobium terrae TaxID=1639882 RepID=A0A841GZT8_9BACT|nr:Uma2 family endonuclease [Longimicrobium terrae]MBB4636773.1 Uma2 family endonuclease [Longimicrobium terrae]MBB6071228.1 Uma2 family endonuclease [Longimicrobium terrae]NNC29274.1 Uma2 family endonuclease [Longimicrobium terrae]